MDISVVWFIVIVFFSFLQVCGLHCNSQAYFTMLIPRLSVTDTICLNFHFSVSRPRMGGIWSPISFCLHVVTLSVHRASTVWDRVQE